MNVVRRVAKNTATLIITDVISKILGFFFIMYTACYFGLVGFGMTSIGSNGMCYVSYIFKYFFLTRSCW